MTDILIPVDTKTVYCLGVKHKGQGEVQFIASYEDGLFARKRLNKLNCTRGISTGDVYLLEEMEVTL